MSTNILVLGDVMLDTYMEGKIDRISPEAPVPILSLEKSYSCLGGAANLAANIKSMGGNPILISSVGIDITAEHIYKLLRSKLIHYEIQGFSDLQTTEKIRILNTGAHILRVDKEEISYLNDMKISYFVDIIKNLFKINGISAVVFSDYNKGFLTHELICSTILMAREHSIPIFADPKEKNFSSYAGIDCLKPNLKEFSKFIGVELDIHNKTACYAHMQKLIHDFELGSLIVTAGKEGSFLIEPSFKKFISTISLGKEFKDSAGAGDTFMAALVLGYLNSHSYIKSVEFAVLAASSTCKHVGAVEAEMEEIIKLNNGNTFFT